MWKVYVNFFELTKTDYNRLVEECMLDEEYSKLLEFKIKNYSRAKMAMELGVSEHVLDVMIKKLKKKLTKFI